MSEPEFELPPILALHEDHDFAAFDCGNAARNIWLRARALDNQVAGFSRVFAAVRDRRVIGFYALSAASILRSDLPAGLRRNAPDPLPMFLPGQLAVDLAWQKRALATRLILDAFQRTTQAAELVGCRFLGVSPASLEIVEFRRKFDFRVVAGVTPPLMVLPLPMIRALLAAARS